jgi:hypothetical protein
MPGPWNDTLKMFISENPQDFASLLFEGVQVTGKLRTEFKKRTSLLKKCQRKGEVCCFGCVFRVNSGLQRRYPTFPGLRFHFMEGI